MKIKGEQLETMRVAFTAVVKHYGFTRQAMGDNIVRSVWQIWHRANDDMRCDDRHPRYTTGGTVRIVPHNPTFDVYADGISDRHIETALLCFARELDLTR